MKRNPSFKIQIMESSYFQPDAKESLLGVVTRWGSPFPVNTVYTHMRRHQAKDIPSRDVAQTVPVPLDAIESEVTSTTAHEKGLDEIIIVGRKAVRSGEIKITAQSYLTAIRTKAEIERSTKDRRLDVVKMFSGAFENKENNKDGPRPTTISQ